MRRGANHLKDKRVGIIGAGVMGGALCRGLINAGAADPANILVSDPHTGHLEGLQRALQVRTVDSNADVAAGSDLLILAVKPQTLRAVLVDIAPEVTASHLVISIVAGARIATIETALAEGVPVIRAMPNTAAQVNQAASAFCRGAFAADLHVAWADQVFSSIGTAIEVDERMMDAVTALSGSGPAYVYMLIESLVDGGVKVGLPRDLAHQLASQTVLGAAKMVIETGRHPAELKDMVATPSGTTITALAALEHAGFRAALIDAVECGTRRAGELGE